MSPYAGRIALLLTTALLAGCATPDAGDAPHDHVRAVVLPYLTHAPMHIAAEEGFFAAQGLDVEFIRLGRHVDLMSALAQQDVDVAAGMLTVNELNLAASGARVRMIAAMGSLDPEPCSFTSFVTRREHLDSGALEDPDRFRELRIDTNLMLPFGYMFDEFLQPLGLNVRDLDITDVPSPAAVEAIESGALDLTLTSEPFLGMHLAGEEAVIWRAVGERLPDYVITMMMYGPRLLDERPDIGERFAVAVLQAIRQYNRGKTPRNLEIVERATGLSAEQVAAACWAPMSDDARLDPTVFRGYQQWNVAAGFTERVLADDELFDPRFIDHANAELAQ